MLSEEYTCDINPSEEEHEHEGHEETISLVKENIVDAEQLDDLAKLYKIFGDGTRIRILAALECSELCVHDLTVVLDMTKSAISHQLKILRDNNLVKFEKKGKHAYYSLADNHVKKILDIALEHINE